MLYRLLAIVMFAVLLPLAVNAGVTVYPGAKEDKATAAQAMKVAGPGRNAQIWTTSASFEKVAAFYRALYKEYTMPSAARVMAPYHVKMAFFILDGAADLNASKSWMKVQRPWYTGVTTTSGRLKLTGLRDITYIEAVQKVH
jgi:hypothetical protein